MTAERFSDGFAWWVAGVDADGQRHALASFDEAEVVALFWSIADTHSIGELTFYGDGSKQLWANRNTELVQMGQVNFSKALRLVEGQHNVAVALQRQDDEAASA